MMSVLKVLGNQPTVLRRYLLRSVIVAIPLFSILSGSARAEMTTAEAASIDGDSVDVSISGRFYRIPRNHFAIIPSGWEGGPSKRLLLHFHYRDMAPKTPENEHIFETRELHFKQVIEASVYSASRARVHDRLDNIRKNDQIPGSAGRSKQGWESFDAQFHPKLRARTIYVRARNDGRTTYLECRHPPASESKKNPRLQDKLCTAWVDVDDGLSLSFRVHRDRIEDWPERETKVLDQLQSFEISEAQYVVPYASNVAALGKLSTGDEFRDCAVCPKMVVLPPGSFAMGQVPGYLGGAGTELPHQEITIGYSLAIAKFEISFAEYQACNGGGSFCRLVRRPRRELPESHANTSTGWHDAKAYADWLSRATGRPYRLLSESEFEYATRAGAGTIYWWGGKRSAGMANCYKCDPEKQFEFRVRGAYPPNPFGLHDMAAGVTEWVEDCWHPSLERIPLDGRPRLENADCTNRVLRGGSATPHSSSRTMQLISDPGEGNPLLSDSFGFRVAFTINNSNVQE